MLDMGDELNRTVAQLVELFIGKRIPLTTRTINDIKAIILKTIQRAWIAGREEAGHDTD